jgi:hypothetical protein
MTLEELHRLFKQRVITDLAEFGNPSVYLPNPILTQNPLYALVAMEPSTSGKELQSVKQDVDAGFLNFLYSEEDFILHYSAYSFLCDGNFHYMITDISKGAMKTKYAGKDRDRRYLAWFNLLKKELDYFGNPLTISVGKKSFDQLSKKLNYPVGYYVWHYSRQNCVHFSNFAPSDWQVDMVHEELRNFSSILLENAGYKPDMRSRILDRIFNKSLSKWKHGLLAYYRKEFISIKNTRRLTRRSS